MSADWALGPFHWNFENWEYKATLGKKAILGKIKPLCVKKPFVFTYIQKWIYFTQSGFIFPIFEIAVKGTYYLV